MTGTVDQVRVRVRTHAPSSVVEREFGSAEEAIDWLQGVDAGVLG